MSRAETAFPAALILVVGGLLAGGVVLAGYSWKVVAFPFGAGAIVCGLCVMVLGTMLSRARHQPTIGPAPTAAPDVPEEPLTWSSVAWVLVLGLFLYGLGFVFGPAAYLLLYLRAHGFSWLTSVAISTASMVVTWGLFIKMLRVLLPIQPLWLG